MTVEPSRDIEFWARRVLNTRRGTWQRDDALRGLRGAIYLALGLPS